MTRISRHHMFLEMAKVAARRSTCYRLNVGAVIVRDANVISIGYNGASSGRPHCTGHGCLYYAPQTGCGVVHAERNALERLDESRAFHDWGGYTPASIYVTHSPCLACAQLILANDHVKIEAVFFETAYRDSTPLDLLKEEIEVYQVLPSGMRVDLRTGALVE